MANKSEIRKMIKVFKSETEPVMVDFAGEVIGYRVMSLSEYKDADIVFIYADYNKEVKTDTIITDALKAGKKVALPKVYNHSVGVKDGEGSYMKFHYITALDQLEKGYNGIREPKENMPVADSDSDKAIMIMPMVAFDGYKNRVGYGGGYYDRYLNTHNVCFKLGLAYEEQKVDSIDDKTEFDIKPDVIITQKNIYR